MSSLRSHRPARTPSRTSHAFRTNQNDHFSPFGSLAELNAATTQLAPPPPHGSMYAGSDRGRETPQRAHRNNLPPPPEDDMGSFYGDEIDYGKVTSQLHPNDAYFPPGSNGGFQGSQHGGSQLPSRTGTGWGSRPESIQERAASPGQQHPYGAYGTHHAFDYEDEFAPPNPPFRQWEGSKAGSVASRAQHARQPSRQGSSQVPLEQWHGSHAGTAQHEPHHVEHDEVNFVPTIQVESPYPEVRDSRTPSPRPPPHHPVVRTRSSRASIHMEEPPMHGVPGSHHEPEHHFGEPDPVLARKKSSRRAVKQRAPSRHASAARSRSTVYSIAPHFDVDGDDVTMYVYLQWMDMLNERPCRFHITGVDGKNYTLEVDYTLTGMTHGSAKFRGAGLPHSEYRGRGKLVVEWEITFHNDDDGSSSD